MQQGFYMVEVIVVVGILSFFAMLSIPHFSFVRDSIVRAELDKIHSTFCYLQQMAMTDNQIYELNFDDEKNCYSYQDKCCFLHSQVKFGVLKNVLGPPSDPKELLESGISFTDLRTIFYPTGIIKPGIVCLVDLSETIMYCVSNSVSQVSFIRKYSYQNGWALLS